MLRAPLRDFDVQVDERRTEEAADAHGDEDGNIPKVPPIILEVITLLLSVYKPKSRCVPEPRAREITCVEI